MLLLMGIVNNVSLKKEIQLASNLKSPVTYTTLLLDLSSN